MAFQNNVIALQLPCLSAIDTIKDDIAKSCLASPNKQFGPLLLETDASGSQKGAALSQAERPIAFFSRTLSQPEQKQSTVEREAMAIVESFRKWAHFIKAIDTTVKTDQKSVSFIVSRNKSKIKNDKLVRWRLELSEFKYYI